MIMRPLTLGTEDSLRHIWWRAGQRCRFVDLGAFDERKLREPLRLGLVETKTGARGRRQARLTAAGLYYARLVVATPPRPTRATTAARMVERLPLFAAITPPR